MEKTRLNPHLEKRIDEIIIEVENCEEVLALENEFYANYEFIKSFIPDSYWNNWSELEYLMSGIRLIEAEKAYLAGLHDGMSVKALVNREGGE